METPAKQNARQKLGGLEDARIGHENVETAKLVRRRAHEVLAGSRIRDIAGDINNAAGRDVLGFVLGNLGGFLVEAFAEGLIGGETEVVDGDVGALAEVLEGNGPADARGAAGDAGGLAAEDSPRNGSHCEMPSVLSCLER